MTPRIVLFLFALIVVTNVFAQAPTVASFSPTKICQGDAVTITGTNFTGVKSVQLGSTDAASFTINSATKITAIVGTTASTGKVTVEGVSSATNLTIDFRPKPALTDLSRTNKSFTNCDNAPQYTLEVSNNSITQGTGNKYEINWGDGSAIYTQNDIPSGTKLSHTFTTQGYSLIVIKITPSDGSCPGTQSYQFYNGKNSLGALTTTTSTTGFCAPAPIEFKVDNWDQNTPGTEYIFNYGDDTPLETKSHPLKTGGGIFLITHNYLKTSCPAEFFKATLQVRNGCLTTTYTADQISIRAKPQANFKVQPAVCIGQQICVENTTVKGTKFGDCSESTDFEWNFGDGTKSTEENPGCHTYATPGIKTITLNATSPCGTDTKVINVNVQSLSPAPTVTSPLSYCANETAQPLNVTGTDIKYYTSGGTLLSTPPTPTFSTTYYVTQTLSGRCESPKTPITVTFSPLPAAPSVTSPVFLCTGTTGSPLTASGSNLKWYDKNGALPGAPTPTGAATYYVTQTQNNCEGPKATITVTETDKPIPPTVNTPLNYCQGQNAPALTANGTNLKWYTSNGTLLANAPTPSTATPGTVTYSVTQTNNCGESPKVTITVNVNTAPAATISYSPTTLCNAAGSADVTVNRNGTAGGTYSISPSGLTINPTTGTLSPANANAGTYTISYTLSGSGGCNNVSTTATVTVTKTPAAIITYPDICSNDGVTNPTISGSNGGTFTSDAGLSINPTTGAITPSASTIGNHTVKYEIAAALPCPGFQTTATVTITKAPAATISYTPVLCNTAGSPAVNVTQTGDANGTYSISPTGGMSINPSTGTLTPAGAVPGTYTIRYTLTGAGGCDNVTTTANVSVSGAPTATISYPDICSSDGLTNVNINGSGGGIYTSTAGLSINASTGAITPSTSTPGTYTVKYEIAAASPCPGFQTTTTVKITAAPAATITYPATLCNTAGTPPVNVIQTGTTGGTYFITPLGMTMSTVTGQLNPAGAPPGVYTITYRVYAAGGCNDYNIKTTVTVNSTPSATIKYNTIPYCGNITTPQPVEQTGTTGGTYSAPAGLTINATTGAITPSTSRPGTYTVTYAIAESLPCPAFSTTAAVTITESPVISFATATQAVCSGEQATFTPTSTVTNTNYSWAVSGSLPANVTGTSTGNFTGNLSLLYTNTGNTDANITIAITPYNPVTPPCPGAAVNITLTVHPAVVAPAARNIDLCMGAPTATLSATPATGHTLRWYDAQQNVLPAAPVIATNDSVRLQYYVSQRSSFGCEGPKTSVVATVHPTLKITGSDFTNPIACGVPSGTIVLQTRDLNDRIVPNIPVVVNYKKFQIPLVATAFTDNDGKITLQLTAGSYTDIYAVSTGGCATAHLNDIFLLKDPDPPAVPVAGYNPPICSGTPLTLTALSATSPQDGEIEYVWAGPAFGKYPDTVTTTVVTFPSASVSHAGTYAVYAMKNNCISAADTFMVSINRSPSKPVISTRNPLCVGDNLFLHATSGIADNSTLTYLWTGPGRGFPTNTPDAGIDTVALTDGGRYTITVTSESTGCSVSTDTLIGIGDYPIVRFATDTITLPTGYKITLDAAITNATEPGVLPIKNYTWLPDDNLSCNNTLCDKPVLTVKKDACYQLQVTNIYGCSDADTLCVRAFCEEAQVFVPNAFTPDGLPDNRILMVRGSGISSVKAFRVFNRWGKIMFERSNFAPNVASYGWNGYINGRKADTGVYVYTVDVICENGTPYTIKGNVTLF